MEERRGVTTDECRETFRTFLSERGLRITNQRLAIFEAAFRIENHFTAEELLERARAIDSSVSRATVYRTLPILTESSLVREIDVGKDFKFYLANPEKGNEQAQILCLDCDKIFEIDAPFLEWYGSSVSSKFGLKPVSQRLQISAQCSEYRATGVCKNHS